MPASASSPAYPVEGVNYPPSDYVESLLSREAWIDSSLGELCREAARDSGDKPFLISEQRQLTFAELDRRSECLAAGLLQCGLRPGDAALFQMGTEIETAVALFGAFKAGVLPVCTLPQHRSLEIDQIGRVTRPRAYFVQADVTASFDIVDFAKRMAANLGTVKCLIVTGSRPTTDALDLESLTTCLSLDDARRRINGIRPRSTDVALLQLSGGSTGVPKVIPRFHGDYLATGKAWGERLGLGSDDVGLWSLPMIHNAAMVMMLWPLMMVRGRLVIESRFEISSFLSSIKRHGVTYTGSIGPIAPRLLDHHDLRSSDLSSLRRFITLQNARAIQRRIGVPATSLYGITEGLLMVSGTDDPEQARFDTVGRPVMALDTVRILEPQSEEEVEDGQIGELCFRGPTTLFGYLGAPELSAGSFTKTHLFRSGDLVRTHDIEGKRYFSFEGRLTDNINRGGEKFGAEEVERLVAQHPAVVDVKVVAMPDQHLGEKACAFIIPSKGTKVPNVEELGRFLTDLGLAKYKRPERIEVLESFPLTNVGKVDKTALRAKVAKIIFGESSVRSAASGQSTPRQGGAST